MSEPSDRGEPGRRDSTPLGDAARRIGDHFAAQDARGDADGGGTDPIEVWGRRIGRALSVVLALLLIWWLAAQLGVGR